MTLPRIDMHLHSTCSDGKLSPSELVLRAKRNAVGKLALTDHDTVSGWEEAQAACEAAGMEFLPGIELTCYYELREIHMLAYGLRRFEGSELQRIITDNVQTRRLTRYHEMVDRMIDSGLPIDREIAERHIPPSGQPGRPHLAMALVEMGIAKSVMDAFDRFLSAGRSGYVEKFNLQLASTISLIHEAGGVAIMAHPGVSRCDEIIASLFRSGLDGLEVVHSSHGRTRTRFYGRLTRKYGGIATGGSDFHGPDGMFEPGFPRVPPEFWDHLLIRLKRYE